ncbi:18376_t:CDS:2, partial [Entrophospora sp. SA101]
LLAQKYLHEMETNNTTPFFQCHKSVTYKGIFEYQQHIFYLCTLEINEVIVGKALLAYTS